MSCVRRRSCSAAFCAGCIVLLAVPGVEARKVRIAAYNVHNGVGTVGTVEYDAAKAVIQRIDADIMAFDELYANNYSSWTNLAFELGYTNFAMGNLGPLAGNYYMGFYSRYPILSTFNVTSPPGAVDLTRFPFRAVIDVPGAQRPLALWTMHHKSSSASVDSFRRAVEAIRVADDMNAYHAAHSNDLEFVFVGDFNDDLARVGQPSQFNSLPSSGLPASYSLGADITFPVLYRLFPTDRYSWVGGGLSRLAAYQQGTNDAATFPSSHAVLDYIYLSDALATSAYGSAEAEVYNSARDAATGGLSKAGSPPDAGVSTNSSDHFAVFADIHMADVPDGIPDDWRLAHFGHIEQRAEDFSRAADDADGDGIANLDEYLADTQPTNRQSVLAVTDIRPGNAGAWVSWQGGTAARQKIEHSAGANAAWEPVLTNEPPTSVTGSALIAATNTTGWFRIRAER